ncbi:MAG: hypothetical protein AAGL24_29520 [Pseudomonadota bacterium]
MIIAHNPTSPFRSANGRGANGSRRAHGPDDPAFRVRIALGVTHDPADARILLGEFVDGTGGGRMLAVIASRHHLGRYTDTLTTGDNGTKSTPVFLYEADNGLDPGDWQPDDADDWQFRSHLKDFDSWMAPTLVSRLKSHLDQRALILAIPLHSSREEQHVCQLLLKRAVDYMYVQDTPYSV